MARSASISAASREPTNTGAPSTEALTAPGATPMADLLAELARPPTSDVARARNNVFSQLVEFRIHDARVGVVDRQLGATWCAPQAEIDLTRQPQGGVDGTAECRWRSATSRRGLTASATLAAGATATHLRARLTPVAPSRAGPRGAGACALTALDAPVSGEVRSGPGGGLAVRQARLTVRAGAGTVHIGQGSVPILDAALVASGTPNAIDL